jgi:CRISPR-associated protein Csx10
MQRMRLQLKALSPLAFGARRGTTSSFLDTLDYVPGTTLRGAVAARYLGDLGTADDERFRNLFLHDRLLFANLYPIRDANISYVIPATACSCKAYKGFLADNDTERNRETHGVADILMRAASFQLFEDYALLDAVAVCPRCSQPTDRFAGFYEQPLAEPSHYKVNVSKRHLTHVGINRDTQTAEHGFLYAQQVINEVRREKGECDFRAQMFGGDLLVAEEQVDFVQHTLLAEEVLLRVGESRSRGLGRVAVVQCEAEPSDTEEMVAQRIATFNEQLSALSQPIPVQTYIVMTLQSDAIVTDAFMRPKSLLGFEDIDQALRSNEQANSFVPESWSLVYANAGTRLVQSWNAASGYPKPDDVAITASSVFLFAVANASAADLAGPLTLLQEWGLGKRRSEGFGRVIVCDTFHWEVKELWQAI